jgi:hypothetical protein
MRNKLMKSAAVLTLAFVAGIGGTQTATAGSGNNVDGMVDGHSYREWGDGTGRDCPEGSFCIYQHRDFGGAKFVFWECGVVHSLSNWNGRGSWVNNQTDNAVASLYGWSGNVYAYAHIGGDTNFDFNPVYTLKPC